MQTPVEANSLNDKRTVTGWVFFDWANSAFALVITVAIFPIYFEAVTDKTINFLGIPIDHASWVAYSLSIAYLVIAAFSPLLSGIADYGGKKLFFLKFFTYLGAISCLTLFFFKGMDQVALATIAFILGMIGFAGGFVFYNSYLPEIVTEDKYDIVSARGFAMGFLGSMLLLLVCLLMTIFKTDLGFAEDSTLPARISFVLVGIWWLGFSLIPFRRLPPDPKNAPQKDLFKKGWQELTNVWKAVKVQANTKIFLLSFFCYSAGVQTVLYLASTFAANDDKLNFGQTELISVILLLQMVGIAGAYFFAKVSDWKGNKFSLISMLLIWLIVCVAGYFMDSKLEFYLIASAIGMAMGGTQSLSRSTYSKIIPAETEDTTSYFSFYDVLEKVATVLGTAIFGIVNQITGDMRMSLLALAVFFIIGILSMTRVTVTHAQARLIENA